MHPVALHTDILSASHLIQHSATLVTSELQGGSRCPWGFENGHPVRGGGGGETWLGWNVSSPGTSCHADLWVGELLDPRPTNASRKWLSSLISQPSHHHHHHYHRCHSCCHLRHTPAAQGCTVTYIWLVSDRLCHGQGGWRVARGPLVLLPNTTMRRHGSPKRAVQGTLGGRWRCAHSSSLLTQLMSNNVCHQGYKKVVLSPLKETLRVSQKFNEK